jgi:acyl carrier protein phosphodiesterase
VCFAEKQSSFAEKQPWFAEKQSCFPEKQSCFPDKQSCFTKKQYCFDEKQYRFDNKQYGFDDKQYGFNGIPYGFDGNPYGFNDNPYGFNKMNFLAHLHLSGSDDQVMIGNFIGDHIKGDNFSIPPSGNHLHQKEQLYNKGVIKGIKLHRLIDAFTDSHPLVHESKKRLRPHFHKYSPVIVDVFYDHFLAKNWNKYHPEPLQKYVDYVYSLLKQNENILPEKTKKLVPYMIQHNWLKGYSTLEGINRALTRMSRRAKFDSKMDQAATFLEKDYELYQKEFEQFFPELKNYCVEKINVL